VTAQERGTQVRQVIAEIAKIDDAGSLADDADVYRDLGIKSVNALDLLLSLEDTFEISIPDEAFGDARTVGSLDNLVASLS